MFISNLCGPAILYIGFSLIQIIIDSIKNNYESALIKFIIMIVLAILLNILCNIGFSVISWFLVFIPIIMMTIMSTLTLRIFGLTPDTNTLQSKVYDASTNITTQSSPINNVERIDRDIIRKKLYDDIENTYDLSSNSADLYDLSQNPKKFGLVDTILNYYGDNNFIDKIVNTRIYNQIFNNYNPNYSNPTFFTTNTTDSYLSNLRTSNKIMSLNKDVTPDAQYSYANTSDVKNLYNTTEDGYFIYYEEKKDEFTEKYPNLSQPRRDKLIENEWNGLTSDVQEVYNNKVTGTTTSTSSYNPNNLSSYRSPLISLDYKRNRNSTFNWSAQCPPNQTISGNYCIDTKGDIKSSLNIF